jgi:transposase
MFGTTHTSVAKWASRYREGGVKKLLARPRGRPSAPRLSEKNSNESRKLIIDALPEQIGLTGPLWTWRSVQALLFRQSGIEFSRWTVSRYLKEWGFQFPASQSEKAQPLAVIWNEKSSSYDVRSCWIKTQSLIEKETRRKSSRYSIMWAIGGRGEAAFMAFETSRGAEAMVEFLTQLLRHFNKRVLTVKGDEALFQSEPVRKWLANNNVPLITSG